MEGYKNIASSAEKAIQHLENLDWDDLIQCCQILDINHMQTGKCGVHAEAPKSELIKRIKSAVTSAELPCLESFTAFVDQCVEAS